MTAKKEDINRKTNKFENAPRLSSSSFETIWSVSNIDFPNAPKEGDSDISHAMSILLEFLSEQDKPAEDGNAKDSAYAYDSANDLSEVEIDTTTQAISTLIGFLNGQKDQENYSPEIISRADLSCTGSGIVRQDDPNEEQHIL